MRDRKKLLSIILVFSNPVKTTKKITPTTPTAKPVPYQIANPTPTPEDDPILVSRINF